jgi:uncharacterized membrane protein YdjX (TVP38/TMEM64 family)
MVNRLIRHGVVWRRAAILAALCVALAVVAGSETLHDALISVFEVIEKLVVRQPLLGAVLFVAFAAISAMLAFVSIAVIVPAAVLAWGEALSMLLLWIGWILGGCASYSVGRLLGPHVVRWLAPHQVLHRFARRVQRDAPFGLVLLFQLALPSEIPGYVLGLARYRFLKYLLALGIAELPYAAATIYLGASFIEGRGLVILVAGIALVALSLAAFLLWRRKQHAGSK